MVKTIEEVAVIVRPERCRRVIIGLNRQVVLDSRKPRHELAKVILKDSAGVFAMDLSCAQYG